MNLKTNIKKTFAAVLAFAVAACVSAQTVRITNELSTQPKITIDGKNANYWKFTKNFILRDEIIGEAITADKRAKVKVRLRFDLQTLNPGETSILSVKPRWSWNSSADASDGNRSAVAAIVKPFDWLEIGVGNLESTGYAFSAGPNVSRNMWTDKYKTSAVVVPGLAGKWQYIHMLASDGLQVCYTGIPNLKLGAALISPDDDRDTTIKKGLFRGVAAAAKYSAELFDVGAVWKGNFGAEKGYKAEDCDKAYQDHTLYAGFTFKGFANAKVGTKLNAALGYYTGKESKIAGTKNVQSFLVAVGADFDFRNGISDTLSVGVGYSKDGELQTKVLPFVIRNTFRYSISKEAGFAMELCYAQAGLKEKTSVAANKNVPNGNAITPTNYKNEYGWMVVLKPGFSFVMGANTFSLGLKALVLGDIEPHGKQGHEMSWTGLRGRQASIDFPFSWEYKF